MSRLKADRSRLRVQKAPTNTQQIQTHLQISPDHLALHEPRSLWRCCSQGEEIPFSAAWACSVGELKAHKQGVIYTEEQRLEDQTAHLPSHCHAGSLLQIPCEQSGQRTPQTASLPPTLARYDLCQQGYTEAPEPLRTPSIM